MNSLAEFHQRAAIALRAFQADPALAELVKSETDAFFARHRDIERTPLTEAYYGSLILDRLSPPDSQSGAPTPTQQVA